MAVWLKFKAGLKGEAWMCWAKRLSSLGAFAVRRAPALTLGAIIPCAQADLVIDW